MSRAKRQYFKPPRSRVGLREETQLREEKQKSNFLFDLFCLLHYLCNYKSKISTKNSLSITGNSAGLALAKLQNDHAKNSRELVFPGLVYGLLSQRVLIQYNTLFQITYTYK